MTPVFDRRYQTQGFIVWAGLFLACLSGCATSPTPRMLLPLTAENLEKARKHCHIRDVALLRPDVIRFSGLQTLGTPPRDYDREIDYLHRWVEMPKSSGISIIVG
jgi:hypothetical protein